MIEFRRLDLTKLRYGGDGMDSEKFYVADESLGEVEREYVAVDKTPKHGDLVKYPKEGRIGKAIDSGSGEDVNIPFDTFLSTAISLDAKPLDPTGNVRIDGVIYRMFELKEPPKSVEDNLDMIASLAKEVATLKKDMAQVKHTAHSNRLDIEEIYETLRVDMAKRVDVEKFAETATNADYKAGQALTTLAQFADKIEMLIDDMVTIDERTQPLVDEGVSDFAAELAEMIERKINESYSKGRI